LKKSEKLWEFPEVLDASQLKELIRIKKDMIEDNLSEIEEGRRLIHIFEQELERRGE